MRDLDRRARRLVGGWPSGGLVVGLLPDSSARGWSGEAALELATAAAGDRLAALVLDLAPDNSDLADRFGADPEPGFAQVMTGEVELSQIQYWDATRGAYYLPGGVRVLGDKVAKSRSVEALAERVRGQEGILFVLLDSHAAEAAAEAGWLDGVVRLGDADLGGPRMFGEVDALGRLERRQPVEEPEEPETAPAAGPAPSAEPVETEASDQPEEADLSVDVDESPETEAPTEPAATEVPGESAEPRQAAGTGVMDPTDEVEEPPVLEVPEDVWETREAGGDPGVTDEPEIAAEAEELEAGDEAPGDAEADESRQPATAEIAEAGVVAEPESAEPAVAGEPEVAEADVVAEPQSPDAAEVEADEQPAEPEVADEDGPSEEIGGTEVGAEPEIAEEPGQDAAQGEDEPDEAEVAAEPEISEAAEETGAEVGSQQETDPDTEAEEPEDVPAAEEPPEAEIEEPAAADPDRPVGLERFAEIPDDSEEIESPPEVGDRGEAEAADEEGETVPTEVIAAGLDVWPEEAGELPASGEPAGADASPPSDAGEDGDESVEPAGDGVIAAALWARPEENGQPDEAREEKSEDFITPAMWAAERSTAAESAAGRTEDRPAVIMGRGQWAPDADTEDSAPVDEPADPETDTDGEQQERDAADGEDSGEHQRADFILDGLELPPEWSEEWEEEERAAIEEQEARTDAAEPDSSAETYDGAEEGKQADFVTQGMGIPDEETEDDPWPGSGTASDWERSPGESGESWERDPYGGSGSGRRAGATAGAGDGRGSASGLALERRGAGRSGLWKRARTAMVVILSVGAVGVLGSAVLDSGPLSAFRDVVATDGSGPGDAPSSGGGSGDVSGSVAAASAGGGAPATAAADTATSSSGADDGTDPSTGTSSSAAATEAPSGLDTPVVSDGPRFRAVTDSLAASIEQYGDRIELYREGTIGCPLLMSAREEAGRLFVRLSMFRLSDGARPDSTFRRAYGSFSRDMETVEQTYRQTECPRPSTAPRESTAAGLYAEDPAPADTARPPVADSMPGDSAGAVSDTASAGPAAADTAPSEPASDSSSIDAPADTTDAEPTG